MFKTLVGFDRESHLGINHILIALSRWDWDFPLSLSPPALHLAALAGSAKCVSPLLSAGADPNLQDNFQQTPLFPACEGGHAATIEAVSCISAAQDRVQLFDSRLMYTLSLQLLI